MTADIPADMLSAMVLAAGLGTRMRPLTNDRPKPLVEVAGRTLLDHVLDLLQAGGVRDVVVNVHYLADQVEEHLASAPAELNIQISDERKQLMETGGGLAQALPLIGSDPFLAVNSDNIWTNGQEPVLDALLSGWDADRMDALLLLVPLARTHCHKGKGDFHLAPSGQVMRHDGKARSGEDAPLVYTGLQMVAKKLFDGVAVAPFSMNRLWDQAISEGRLYGVVHEGRWFDVGNPDAVGQSEAILLGR